jgi:hypothetical protein
MKKNINPIDFQWEDTLMQELSDRLGYLKYAFSNSGIKPFWRENSDLMIDKESVARFVRTTSLQIYWLQINRRRKIPQELEETIQDFSKRIFKLQWVQEEKKTHNKTSRKQNRTYIDPRELLSWIQWRLSVNATIIENIKKHPPLSVQKLQRVGSIDLVKNVVRQATLDLLWLSPKTRVNLSYDIESVIQTLATKIYAFSTLSRDSQFYTVLRKDLQQVVFESDNFWSGFTGYDLEEIGYKNLNKFTKDALQTLLEDMRIEDATRSDIIWDIARNIKKPEIKHITKEMIQDSFRGYDSTKEIESTI